MQAQICKERKESSVKKLSMVLVAALCAMLLTATAFAAPVSSPTEPTPSAPVVDIPDPDTPLVDVPDPDVPLVDVPDPDVPLVDVPDPDVPLVDVPDPDVPLVSSPQTGAAGMSGSALLLAAACAAGGAALLAKGRKQSAER